MTAETTIADSIEIQSVQRHEISGYWWAVVPDDPHKTGCVPLVSRYPSNIKSTQEYAKFTSPRRQARDKRLRDW
jgi:hypothetical protein